MVKLKDFVRSAHFLQYTPITSASPINHGLLLIDNDDSEDSKSSSRELTCNDYTVGWICALPKEQTAAIAMLDHTHPELIKPPSDPNAYTLGCIGEHKIVIACLPKGKQLLQRRWCGLFRLSSPVGYGQGGSKRLLQADWCAEQSTNRTVDALTKLETKHEMHGTQINQYLDVLGKRYPNLISKYTWSDSLKDPISITGLSDGARSRWQYMCVTFWEMILAVFMCVSGLAVLTASPSAEREAKATNIAVDQLRRNPRDMRVHYGLIASGDQVIKDAVARDSLNKSLGGICDYADAQKTKDWQEYAAAVAAACAKELLEYVQPSDVEAERPMKDILGEK
ncbi:uncharacterized protein N7484_009241 [Penicillium longicatenatum]|uniref:uncharacterized protein n=1 Tax=Penicillium longicatenatum TaxID=1561947 RepID=UPI00254791DC|nr:uncharacterized protein N7484_009241 [Penicillium longicatenatum]KAJ5635928.1 hypothetical protein N7484_009241 [Penicillium longicatenatum]